MESLAMAAAVVMLAILISGVVAAVVVVRRPRSTGGKALATVVSLPALFLGGWMWQLDVGMGARLTGSTPEELAARLKREQPIWAEMVRISGAQPE